MYTVRAPPPTIATFSVVDALAHQPGAELAGGAAAVTALGAGAGAACTRLIGTTLTAPMGA